MKLSRSSSKFIHSFHFGSCPSFRFFSSRSNKLKIGVIPSDGIGKEVVPAAISVLKSVQDYLPPLTFVELEAGWETFQKKGKALPDETIAELKKCDGGIFGSVSSPSQKVQGYTSPIIGMRKALDLYANLRPVVSAPIDKSKPNIDMLIVRENTECLYVKQEKTFHDSVLGEIAIASRLISRKASTRIGEMAFRQAVHRAKNRSPDDKRKSLVTIVHKSNVLSISDGLFRECVLEVAKKYPQVEVEEQLVDSMVYKLFLEPERYDVIVAPNLYGDILSDAAAALVGGLGLVPSANVSDNYAVVEPVHGSAPDIAGKGVANPIATIRAASLLLENLKGENNAILANLIEKAIFETLKEGPRTPDLGGKATTSEITETIISHLQRIIKENSSLLK